MVTFPDQWTEMEVKCNETFIGVITCFGLRTHCSLCVVGYPVRPCVLSDSMPASDGVCVPVCPARHQRPRQNLWQTWTHVKFWGLAWLQPRWTTEAEREGLVPPQPPHTSSHKCMLYPAHIHGVFTHWIPNRGVHTGVTNNTAIFDAIRYTCAFPAKFHDNVWKRSICCALMSAMLPRFSMQVLLRKQNNI